MTDPHYIGQELEIFEHARNWKKYWSSQVRPYLSGHVLEAGAGLGTNTAFLKNPDASSWTCLEPDPNLTVQMTKRFATQPLLADCRVEIGTTEGLEPGRQFDAIAYIDVLEHIDDDRGELARASQALRRGGKIIVLAPAHQWLYTPFDKAIGHFRRYDKQTLASRMPMGGRVIRMEYLDSVGMLASIGNRLFLSQSVPTVKQILFWDRFLVPPSRLLDRLTLHRVGKSILAVWEKD